MRRIALAAAATVLATSLFVVPSSPAASSHPAGVRQTVAIGQSAAARAQPTPRWKVKVRDWSKPIHRGRQAKIDRCKATLYWGALPGNGTKPAWLAAHDRCGFWRWDKWLPVGAKFTVISPQGTVLKYRVYGRDIINRNSGPSDGLIHGDITLQTCRGPKMTFVYARRTR